MLAPLRTIAGDRGLRLAALALALLGALGASVGPYQSLIAIRLFGLPDSAYSLVLALASVVSVTAALAVGILTDQRANRRRVAVVSAGLMIAGIAIARLGNSPAAFVLAHGLVLPLASTLFGQIFALARLAVTAHPAEHRDAIMAAVRAIFAVPFILVLPLWSLAFRSGAGLLDIYAVIGALALLILGLILRNWPRDGMAEWSDPKSGLSTRASLREIMVPRVALRITILGAIAVGPTMYMILLGLIFNEVPGRGDSDTALFVGAVAGLEVPVMLSLSRMLRLVGRTRLIAAGAAIHAGFLVAFPLLAATPYVWALVFPAALGAGIIIALPIAYLQELMGTRPGMGGALLAVQRVVADALAATAFALGAWAHGYTMAALLAGGIVLCAAALLVIVDRPRST